MDVTKVNNKNSIKRALTCMKVYIQSSRYANREAPRQNERNPNNKIHPFIQTRPPRRIVKISQEKITQSK